MITIDPIKRPPRKSSAIDKDELMKEIDLKFSNLVEGAPEKLDTIKELADAIENLPNLDNFVTDETLNKLLSVSKYEFVDLGLPSGLKWASCNVGSTKPEEYGLYFAWGETQGYTAEDVENGVKQFTWEDYELCNGTSSTLTKYNNDPSLGIVDNLTTLELVDDVLYTSNNTYRMPTRSDFMELAENTILTRETLNDIAGVRLTSKINGNSIFIPAAGYCSRGLVRNAGLTCLLLSNLVNSSSCKQSNTALLSTRITMSTPERSNGYPIRAVQESTSAIFNPKDRLDQINNKVDRPEFNELKEYFNTAIIDNERVTAEALTDLDSRISLIDDWAEF